MRHSSAQFQAESATERNKVFLCIADFLQHDSLGTSAALASEPHLKGCWDYLSTVTEKHSKLRALTERGRSRSQNDQLQKV